MIEFNYETEFVLVDELSFNSWIENISLSESKSIGEIVFIFCDDDYLLKINIEHLQHDFYTDIITFDYSLGDELNGDIFISIERVKENAIAFCVSFDNELQRVMAHGILHLSGYNDKSDDEIGIMRIKENEKIKLFVL